MILIRAINEFMMKLIAFTVLTAHTHTHSQKRKNNMYALTLKYYSQINGNNKWRRKTWEKITKYGTGTSYCPWVNYQASLYGFFKPHSPVTAFRKSDCYKLDIIVVMLAFCCINIISFVHMYYSLKRRSYVAVIRYTTILPKLFHCIGYSFRVWTRF
jgi:hypothetical protein